MLDLERYKRELAKVPNYNEVENTRTITELNTRDVKIIFEVVTGAKEPTRQKDQVEISNEIFHTHLSHRSFPSSKCGWLIVQDVSFKLTDFPELLIGLIIKQQALLLDSNVWRTFTRSRCT
jgi:hypothetical protein